MINISVKLLASIAAVLAAVVVFLGAYSSSVKVSVGPAEPAFGAVATLGSPQDWNFVSFLSEPKGLTVGSSTIYSLKILATTTPVSLTCKINGGFAQAQEFQFAVGNTPNSTSTDTSFGKFFVGAAGSVTAQATTTAFIISPGSYVNVKLATTSGTTISSLYAPTGRCEFFGYQI